MHRLKLQPQLGDGTEEKVTKDLKIGRNRLARYGWAVHVRGEGSEASEKIYGHIQNLLIAKALTQIRVACGPWGLGATMITRLLLRR